MEVLEVFVVKRISNYRSYIFFLQFFEIKDMKFKILLLCICQSIVFKVDCTVRSHVRKHLTRPMALAFPVFQPR
jgi:hypothetical protein